MLIETENLIKISTLQYEKNCSSQAIHNAINRGDLDCAEIDGTYFIIKNEKSKNYQPIKKGCAK